MPKDLGDVLHYFIPEVEAPPRHAGLRRIVTVPLDDDDVVGAALFRNLAVEAARQGCRVTLVSPAGRAPGAWPETGPQPLGIEGVLVDATEPAGLADAADRAAAARASSATEDALVLVRIPAAWLAKGADAGPLLRWLLLLARPDERQMLASYAILKQVASQAPGSRLGVSVYGVRSIAEARATFDRLAAATQKHLGCTLTSYGLLVDDVHLSRSILTQRPVPLSHPNSPAGRALADVARMLREDAAELTGG